MTRALPQLRTRRQWLAWLLLPALLLRALIPAGFMPLAGAGGAYLGFCPGAGASPPPASEPANHASHLAHTHHKGVAPGAPATHHYPACIFSSGALTEFAASLPWVLPAAVPRAPAERVASLVLIPTIRRAQSPRAPPAFA